MNRYITRGLSLLSFVLLTNSWGLTQLTTSTLTATQDSYIDSRFSTGNYGNNTSMSSSTYLWGFGNTQYYRRSFVEFDLSAIPSNAIIYSASLNVTRTGSVSGGATWKTKLITSSWSEGSINAATPVSISNLSGDYVSTTPTPLAYVDNIDVTSMVQRMVYGQVSNYGWSIQVNNESYSGTSGASFWTSEHGTSGFRPKLVVKYFIPLSIATATVTHESSASADDGGVSFTLDGGSSSSYTYTWINGATGVTISSGTSSSPIVLTGHSYGWYGLHVTGSNGEDFYQGFIVGLDCQEVTINFQPDKNYTGNANSWNYSPSIDYGNYNYGNNASLQTADHSLYDFESYLRFDLWMDDALTINQANLTLDGWSHISAGSSNKSEIVEITEYWNESLVTWNASPTTSTTQFELIPASTSSSENKVVDMIEFWNDWKQNNSSNYGVQLQLQDFDNLAYKRQFYFSPAYSSAIYRPKIEFKVSHLHEDFPLICNPELMPYVPLRRSIDGGQGTAVNGNIKFVHKENYQIDTSQYLIINLFDETNDLIASCDASGATTGGMTALKYGYDDNRYILDASAVTGITEDEYYILEVINSTGDKRYLKFLFKN